MQLGGSSEGEAPGSTSGERVVPSPPAPPTPPTQGRAQRRAPRRWSRHSSEGIGPSSGLWLSASRHAGEMNSRVQIATCSLRRNWRRARSAGGGGGGGPPEREQVGDCLQKENAQGTRKPALCSPDPLTPGRPTGRKSRPLLND